MAEHSVGAFIRQIDPDKDEWALMRSTLQCRHFFFQSVRKWHEFTNRESLQQEVARAVTCSPAKILSTNNEILHPIKVLPTIKEISCCLAMLTNSHGMCCGPVLPTNLVGGNVRLARQSMRGVSVSTFSKLTLANLQRDSRLFW